MDIEDTNPNLKDLSEEVKFFLKIFYKNEDVEYLKTGINVEDFNMDLSDKLESDKGIKEVLDIISETMIKYKKDFISELLNQYNTAEHESNKDVMYLKGCEHTMNRIIVDLQKRFLNK